MSEGEQQTVAPVDGEKKKKNGKSKGVMGPISRRFEPVKKYKVLLGYKTTAGKSVKMHKPTIVRRRYLRYAYGPGTVGMLLSRARSRGGFKSDVSVCTELLRKYFLGEKFNTQITAKAYDANHKHAEDLNGNNWKDAALYATDAKDNIHQVNGRHANMVADSYKN